MAKPKIQIDEDLSTVPPVVPTTAPAPDVLPPATDTQNAPPAEQEGEATQSEGVQGDVPTTDTTGAGAETDPVANQDGVTAPSEEPVGIPLTEKTESIVGSIRGLNLVASVVSIDEAIKLVPPIEKPATESEAIVVEIDLTDTAQVNAIMKTVKEATKLFASLDSVVNTHVVFAIEKAICIIIVW